MWSSVNFCELLWPMQWWFRMALSRLSFHFLAVINSNIIIFCHGSKNNVNCTHFDYFINFHSFVLFSRDQF